MAGTNLFITNIFAERLHGHQHLSAGGQGPAADAGGQLHALRLVHHIDLHARRPLHVEGNGIFGRRPAGERSGESHRGALGIAARYRDRCAGVASPARCDCNKPCRMQRIWQRAANPAVFGCNESCKMQQVLQHGIKAGSAQL